MFKTEDGAGIDLKEMSLNINGNVYDQRFLSQIYNYYQQMIKTEFLMENYEFSSEKEAWFVAGEIQHDMDKYGMTEQAAIENGLNEYIDKYRNLKSYKTCEEIREAFIKQGWSADTQFELVSHEELRLSGSKYEKKLFFKMISTGNIFDDRGNIFMHNIPTFEKSAQALDELIAAGDWNIEEDELKSFVNSDEENYEEHNELGRVSFGNYIYVLDRNIVNGEPVVEVGRCYPLLDMGETDEKAFFSSTLNWNELESKYKSDIPEYFDIYIPITDKYANNIDLLKKEIVLELINKGLVTSLYTEEYQKLKDTGIGFPQQFYRRLDRIEQLNELKDHCPEKVKDMLKGKKGRVSDEDVERFIEYYKKVYDLIVDEQAIVLAQNTGDGDIGEIAREEYNRLFVKEAIKDGLTDKDGRVLLNVVPTINHDLVFKKILHEPEIKKLIKKAQSQDMGR